MSPYGYVDLYHKLPVADARLGLDVTLDLTKYRSGWFKEDVAEADVVLGLIGAKLKKPVPSAYSLPSPFYIDNDPRFDPAERFVPACVRRAFASRGSPEDVKDALRLAYASGRCAALGPKAYAEKWFGQDCNAFVGNYLGLTPMISIAGYATGYGKGPIAGGTPDIEACRGFLPLPLVDEADEISTADVLITYGSPDKQGSRFRHIAVVHTFDGSAADAEVKIAEWGTSGGSAAHKSLYKGPLIDDVAAWKPAAAQAGHAGIAAAFRAAFPKRKAIAFPGTDPQGQPALRVFFSGFAKAWNNLDERGYEIAGRFGL